MLEVGKKAPAFNLPDQDGEKHRLSDYAGKWVLIYFYPKDNTSGCTKEACAIRDDWSEFKKLGAVVLGVSKDSVKSHRIFADKHLLPFTLLSDESTKMIEKYGAWRKKKMAGREYMGIVRISYLVDPKGKVAKVYPKVKPPEHAAEVLADLKELT
jgi:peroxiredoxin Q/BCP